MSSENTHTGGVMSTEGSPHLLCTAHSGMTVRLNLNIFLNLLGIILVAVLIWQNSEIKVNTNKIEGLEERLTKLERVVERIEHQ